MTHGELIMLLDYTYHTTPLLSEERRAELLCFLIYCIA